MKINRVVYRLWHNLSDRGRIGYIGKDCYYPCRLNLTRRKKHKGYPKLYQALNKYPLDAWNKEILSSGLKSHAALCKAEIFWIKKFDSKNKGYNCTDGGDGNTGWVASDETRSRMRKAQLGKKASKEARMNMRKAHLGHKHTAESRKKIGEAAKGRKHTPENIEKMIKNHVGTTGYKHTAETRIKMSKSHKALVQNESPEDKQKRRDRMIGNKNRLGSKASAKTRKKMSESMKKAWIKRRKEL